MTSIEPNEPLSIGDAVTLFQGPLSATWVGLVAQPGVPPMVGATMEVVDGHAVITSDVLIGPRGLPGENAPIVKLHWPAPDTADELPSGWAPELENHGFLIGGLLYVWDGDEWQTALPGPQGPPGATPNLTFSYETIPMSERTPEVIAAGDQVIPSGTTLNKHIKIRALSPQGPIGPQTSIEGSPDYDSTKAKAAGRVLTVLPSGKWGPSDFAAKQPRMYSIPEQAFSPFQGFSQRHTILAYTIEPQDYDYVPHVEGHIKAAGVEIFDSDPLSIGCEVRMNNALSGQLIGRGFGNNSTWTHIKPHFSTPSLPTAAVAPDNGVALVRAGEPLDIFVNLYNDGILGAYLFDRPGAQLVLTTMAQG